MIRRPCPTCNKPVEWNAQAHWRPFCSKRCQLIDLGEWMEEGHRISEPADSPPRPWPSDED